MPDFHSDYVPETWLSMKDDEAVRFDRKLGIDDNREGWDHTLRQWDEEITAADARYDRAATVRLEQDRRWAEEPIDPDTLCIDCMKPLTIEKGGCTCIGWG